MGLFPRDIDFFEIFDRDALNITKASVMLIALMKNFEHLEDASDKCEDVANVLEAIVLKYA